MITYGSTTLTSYNTITKIEVYYYKSTSATSLSGGSWSTTKPTWENGKYIWQKIRTTYEGKLENGLYYSESDPVNITGQQGATGTAAYSYKLNASDTIITKSEKGEYSVSKITFTSTSKQGTNNVNAYAGRFKIETTANGTTWTTRYPTSGTGVDESSKEYTIPTDIIAIRCSLYQSGGFSTLLDIMTIPIINDGVGIIDSPYKEVEWVESTGKQYVYLDWKPPIKTWGFEVDFMSQNAVNTTAGGWNESTNKNGYGTIFGVRNSSGVNNAQLTSYNSGLLRIGNSTAIATAFKTDHSRQTIKLHGTTITRANGVTATVTRVDETTGKPYCNMTVFGLYEGLRRTSTGNITEPSSTRIYSLKFYDGDTLAVDLVGSIRKADGITGLYDKVSKHFYPAPGMLFGNEVGDITNVDTVADSLNKADVSTTVVNKNRTRMWETSVPFNRLEDGQKITVTYSYGNVVNSTQTSELVGWDDTSSNSNVYLRLTYPDGTKSEWIPCYYSQTARLTTHYGAGTAIIFTYRENLLSNATETTGGSAIVRGFFANASYYQNTSYTQYSNNVKAGTNGIKGYTLIMKDSEDTWSCFYSGAYKTTNTGKPAYTGGFMLGKILYSAGAGAQTSNSSLDTYYNYKSGVNTSTIYDAYPVDLRYSTNCASTLTSQRPVYIVGTIENDGLFHLDVSQWYTQTEPTYADGKVYVYVGMAYSSYQVWLSTENPAYMFYNGEFILYDKAQTLQNINSLKTSLETQIDNKVETWCQKTNPASSWTAEERPNHTGDLWYYIGESGTTYKNNTTYQYNGETNVWSAYSANPDLFDKIDGKTAIYYGTTSSVTSVEEGDYLVDSENDCTYRWNDGAWVLATDYKQVAIDAIEIGGRNLIVGTDNTTETTKSITSTNSSTYIDTYSKLITRILGATEYVVSFEAKADSNRTIKCYWYSPNTTIYAESSTGQISTSSDGRCDVSVTSEWKRYWVRWKQSDQADTNKNLIIGRLTRPEEGTITLFIRAVKFESGNKATDWTPAPEDITRGTGFYAITTAPTAYTTKVGEFTPSYRVALSTVKSESGLEEVMVGDVIQQGYNTYPVGYVDASYVYLGMANSIRGASGTPGLNTARVILYRRFASAPTGTNVAPTGNVTYTFSTGIAANNLNSWTQAIPSGTDPVYMIVASASSTGTTDTIPKTEWSAPVKILENGTNGNNGTDGYNQATIYLYQRKSGTAPSKPSSAVTYTFSTGALSSTPTGWSRTIPTNDGNPCYVTTAIAVAKTTTYSIPASGWSDVVILSQDGEDGTSITITSTSVKYQKGTSGTTKPTGTWGTSIPSLAENEFLWTQTIVNYSDGSKTEAYSVSRNAKNGTSPTVSSTVVEYQQSTGGTTPPTGTWSSTAPTATAGQYMWTKTTITYSDSKTAVSYSVSKNGANGIDGIDGTSQNLLLDVYASSLTKVKAPWDRYLSDATNTTITGEFIAESNLPDPNATHFYRITDSSATTKSRGLCFYNGGTPPFLDGHTYRVGCWVRNHAGQPKVNIYLGGLQSWTNSKTITNTEWQWIECVHTFGDTDPSINTHSTTYKRLYFYFYNNNVAGSSLDMCGFKVEEIQTDISTARNILLKTEKLENWGTANGASISDGIATFPDVTSDTVRRIYSTNFKYELIRNQNVILSIRVKADIGKMCVCNLYMSLKTTEDATSSSKWFNNYVYFTGNGEWKTICVAVPVSDELFSSGTGTPDYDNCWASVGFETTGTYHNGYQLKQPQLSLGTTATAWSAAPEDVDANIQQVQTNLDNLEIGGRNLLYNSATMPAISNGLKGWRASGGTVTHIDLTNPPIHDITGAIRVTNTGSSTTNIGIAQDRITNKFIAGEKYTQSCWVRASETLRVYLSPIWAANGQSTGGSVSSLGYFSIGTEWTYIKWEGAVLQGEQATSYSAGYVYAYQAPANSWFEVCGMKLEKGVKATDWTPAPEDTQADIDTALAQSVEYIIGTQTTTTGTWTGNTIDKELKVGKTIAYKLPYDGSGNANLILTLADGSVTNAIPVYLNNVRVTTHFKKDCIINMTYDGTAWRASSIPNSDTYNKTLYSQNVKASTATYTGTHIICGTSEGYCNIAPNVTFDLSYPLLYYATAATTTITTTANNHYLNIPGINFSINGTIENGVAYKQIYLKGTIFNNMFTIASSPFLTTKEPSNNDGYYYIPLGIMSSATVGRFVSSNMLYAYIDGAFQPVDTAAVLRAQDAKDRATAVYGTCSTGATTVDKVVTCSNFTLFDGARIQITFTNANTAVASEATTASPTLNINGTGRKPIKIGIEQANTANPLYWAAGATIEFVYDGSAWVLQNAPYTLYGTCNTEENVREKQVVCDGAVICKGTTIYVDMLYSNTADSNSENGNVTLNVANTIAKTIYANNSTLTIRSRYNWNAGENPSFTFDGQYWQMDKDTVPAYITDKDEDGIFVHPINDTASGWSIGKVFELLNNGYSYIKMWLEDVTDNLSAKIRIGREDQHHILLDKEIIQFKKGDTPEELASFSSSGISFDDGVPFKIGNDSTYVQFVDNNSDGVADALEIVADKISFKNGGDNTVQDIQERFNDLQTDISNITNNIEINPTANTPYVAITTQKDEYNAGLKLEPTQLSFQLNGQTTATIANDEMNIPTASVTNLFMQSANQSYEKIWVMRSNGHLSLKVGKQN